MQLAATQYRGYQIFDQGLDALPDLPQIIINTINQYSFCIAEEDGNFKKALQDSDVLLPDGIGIVVAVKAVTGRAIKKIAGADIHGHLLQKLDREKSSCFYLGSSGKTLQKIEERLSSEYPNITSNFYSPPFKAAFTDAENEEMIRAINHHSPEVLFVGMTAPKQEKWVNEHRGRINARFICSIGAVFDFYAGTIQRPQDVWVNLGLEWFVRLCREPARMWKRYLYYGPVFVYILLKERLRTGAAGIPLADNIVNNAN